MGGQVAPDRRRDRRRGDAEGIRALLPRIALPRRRRAPVDQRAGAASTSATRCRGCARRRTSTSRARPRSLASCPRISPAWPATGGARTHSATTAISSTPTTPCAASKPRAARASCPRAERSRPPVAGGIGTFRAARACIAGLIPARRMRGSFAEDHGGDDNGGGEHDGAGPGSRSFWARCSSASWSPSIRADWFRRVGRVGRSSSCSWVRPSACCWCGRCGSNARPDCCGSRSSHSCWSRRSPERIALHAWIGTPDRRLGWIAWCTFPLVFLCGQALTSEVDRRVVLRGAVERGRVARHLVRVRACGLVVDRRVVRESPRGRPVRPAGVRRRGGRVVGAARRGSGARSR